MLNPVVHAALKRRMAPVELLVEARRLAASAVVEASQILGDVDNNGRVHGLRCGCYIVPYYSGDSPPSCCPTTAISRLGDVNADGRGESARTPGLLCAFINDPADPLLPPGIGQAVPKLERLPPGEALEPMPSRSSRHRTTTFRIASPAWSPDGRRIAFVSKRDGDFGRST